MMTLQETIELHQKFGDDGLMDWINDNEEDSNFDIESFKYLFKLRRRLGGLMCPPKIADKIEEWLEPKTVTNTSQKDYWHLGKMIKLGMEFFNDGLDIPDIGPEGLYYNPGPKFTKKKKRNKKRGR